MERLYEKPRYQPNNVTSEYDAQYIIQLKKNYRSHSCITHIPNELFYRGTLQSKAPIDVTDWFIGTDILPNKSFPIIFESVIGNCQTATKGHGYFNKDEIMVLVKYIKRLLATEWNGKEVFLSNIGIVSPYKKQCSLIKEKLRMEGFEDIVVGTAEVFQGQEKSIMLISTVRSVGGLGFVDNERVRSNTANFVFGTQLFLL